MRKGMEQLYALKAQAGDHIKQGRYSEAAVYLKDVLTRFDQEVPHITSETEMEKVIRELQLASRKNLSLCCLKLGRLQGCIEQCRLVLEVEPNNLKVVYRIGRAYLELRQFDSAEHYLRRAFYLDPQEKEVMRSLEEIQRLRQQSRQAEEEALKKNSLSLIGLFKCLIAFLWAAFLFPFRLAGRFLLPAPAPAKRDQ